MHLTFQVEEVSTTEQAVPTEPLEDELPRAVFKKVSMLASGSFGRVLKYKDTRTGSFCAIKISTCPDKEKYLRREMDLLR